MIKEMFSGISSKRATSAKKKNKTNYNTAKTKLFLYNKKIPSPQKK